MRPESSGLGLHVAVRHDEPREDEVEQAYGVHCQRLFAFRLTVPKEFGCRYKYEIFGFTSVLYNTYK